MHERPADVLAHQPLRSVGVAGRDRVEDRPVLGHVGEQPVGLGQAAGEQPAPDLDDPQALERPDELGVAGGPGEQDVEGAARVVGLVRVAGGGVGVGLRLEQCLECREVSGVARSAASRAIPGSSSTRTSRRPMTASRPEIRDPEAAVREFDDQAFAGEPPQRLADRRAGDPEGLGQLDLSEPGPRLDVPARMSARSRA